MSIVCCCCCCCCFCYSQQPWQVFESWGWIRFGGYQGRKSFFQLTDQHSHTYTHNFFCFHFCFVCLFVCLFVCFWFFFFVKQVDLSKKKILMRIDLNVSVDNGRVTNWRRLKESLPTIRYCLERGFFLFFFSLFSYFFSFFLFFLFFFSFFSYSTFSSFFLPLLLTTSSPSHSPPLPQ